MLDILKVTTKQPRVKEEKKQRPVKVEDQRKALTLIKRNNELKKVVSTISFTKNALASLNYQQEDNLIVLFDYDNNPIVIANAKDVDKVATAKNTKYGFNVAKNRNASCASAYEDLLAYFNLTADVDNTLVLMNPVDEDGYVWTIGTESNQLEELVSSSFYEAPTTEELEEEGVNMEIQIA